MLNAEYGFLRRLVSVGMAVKERFDSKGVEPA